MEYLHKYKHAIIGASIPCIMLGFSEYTNLLSVIAYGAPFWIASSIILGIIYGLSWMARGRKDSESA
jgi:integral membrane sensor domain MASE1